MFSKKSAPEEYEDKSNSFEECIRKLNVPEQVYADFQKLKDSQKRIQFVNELVTPDKLPRIQRATKTDKNEEKAKQFKDMGNRAFGKADYKKAIEYYTKSMVITPQEEGTKTLSLAVANRSAALYHIGEYTFAVEDIDVVLKWDYPIELRYKVLERKAKCMLALNRNAEAETEFKKTIQALDDSKLPVEKKLKMQNDIQIMLKMMAKSSTTAPGTAEKSADTSEYYKPRLVSPRNKVYVAACDLIEIKEEPTAGRYAAAAADIAPGDTILIEKPYCSVLLPEFASTNCQLCFKRSLTLHPCKKCCQVVFCSLKCRDSAKFHHYECSILDSLNSLGISVSVFMALRIITQQDLTFFINLESTLKDPEIQMKKYESGDYVRIYNLVHHEDKRTPQDLFERSVLALHLLRYLKEVDYFKLGEGSKPGLSTSELSTSETFIGALILRHLQILQFNAHEISELKITNRNLNNAKSVFIGGGLYSTLALFNHSCDPGIVRYFDGTRVVVRTVKPIKAGEIIAENYGPIYSEMNKGKRQEYLKAHYMFDCNCTPCQENWPMYEHLDPKQEMMRFKCRAWKSETDNGKNLTPCSNVLLVPPTNTEFNLKCFRCGGFTNLLTCLKAIKDNTELTQQALRHYEAGNAGRALAILLKIFTTLHEFMAPPFRDYLLTEQYIRTCMLAHGNKYFNEGR